MDEVNVSGAPVGLTFECQEMPGDGSKCFNCTEPIFGKMFQWFLFTSNTAATPTKFKMCEPCFNKPDE